MDTYYHSTTVPQWVKVITNSGLWVHAGSLQAAQERASRVTVSGLRILEEHDIYSMQISPDARVNPEIIQDLDDNWESLDVSQWDVFQYVNAHESAGEVSIYVRSSVLKNIQRTGYFPPTI